jgi:hypothetical protein
MKSYIDHKLPTSLKNSDDPLLKSPEYHKIMEVINELKKTRMLQSFNGNCIAACEILQSMLSQVGIQSRTVEVELLITRRGEKNEYLFVGFNDMHFPGQVDTHMILITDTPQPIIIDVSIGHVLPPDRNFIIERVNQTSQSFSEHNIENLNLIYREKKSVKFAELHQKNLIQRILTEQKQRQEFDNLRTVLVICLSVTAINFILNSILILLKVINP